MTDLSREEADVFPFNVLPEGHLEQGQAHVQCLNNVALPTARNLEYRYKTKIKQWREYRYGMVGTYVYPAFSQIGGGGEGGIRVDSNPGSIRITQEKFTPAHGRCRPTLYHSPLTQLTSSFQKNKNPPLQNKGACARPLLKECLFSGCFPWEWMAPSGWFPSRHLALQIEIKVYI